MELSFLCSLPVIAGLFGSCGPVAPLATGYVEGEYVQVAPLDVARIDAIVVRRGDKVIKGQTLATIDKTDALIAVHQAEAALDQARSQLANLQEGRRPEEIAVIEANLSSAQVQAEKARRDLARQQVLSGQGIAPKALFDDAGTAVDIADAQVKVVTANLAVAKLPARPMEISSAKAQVKQAEEALANAEWKLQRRTLVAPADGVIDDVIRRVGEIAGPSQSVMTLLPRNAVVLRLYIPEKYLHSIDIGTDLKVRCDGCSNDQIAKVTYLADTPEFTPPVIYSIENRQKLVYLIEARPEGAQTKLRPGQIVDVVLSGDTR